VTVRVQRLRVGAALALLVAGSTALRLWLVSRTQAPVIPDEFVYAELAHSFRDSWAFEIRGQAISVWSFGPLYPMAVSVAYALADDAYGAYRLVLGINCLLWSCAAVPAYLLARRLLAGGPALFVAALSVLVPAGVYTTKVMTESLAYPAFLLACLAVVAALERPTLRAQLLALSAIGLAVLARGQLAALAPAYLTAIGLVALVERRPAVLRAFLPTLAAATLAVVACLAALVRSGGDAMQLAGRTTQDGAGIEPLALAASAVHHVALLDLHVGVAPLAALLVLALAGGPRAQRLVAALAVSLVLWLAVAAAAFLAVAPRTTGDPDDALVFDRYVFYVAPLLFAALLVCVRDRRGHGWLAAAVIAGLLPLTLPFGELLGDLAWGTNTSSVALVPWAILRLGAGASAVLPAVAVFAAILALGFAAARRRPSLAVAATVLGLVVAGASAQLASDVSTRGTRTTALAADPTWIDDAVGADARVAAVRLEERHRTRGALAVWETAFFNRAVGEVYTLDGGFFRNLPARRIRRSLAGVAPQPDYVLVDGSVDVAGRVVAADPRTGLRLVRTGGSLRLGRA
jgi:hypothetical protein